MRARSSLFALLLVAAPVTALAQASDFEPAAPQRVTMEEAVEFVVRSSLRVPEDHTRVDAAAAERIAASTRQNPEFSYRTVVLAGGTNVNGIVQHDAWFEQSGIRPRARRLRIAAADTQVEAAEADAHVFVNALKIETRRAFIELFTAQEQLALLEQSIGELASAEDALRLRASSGAATRLDVLRIEAEQSQWAADAARVRLDRDRASAVLAALATIPTWNPIAEPTADFSLIVDATTALDTHPRVIAAEAASQAAERMLAAERGAARPSLSLMFGGTFTQRPGSAALGGGLSVPLPVFDRNRAAIARAAAEAERARYARDAVRAELMASIESARRRTDVARAAVSTFTSSTNQQVATLRPMLTAALRGGSIDTYAFIDGLRTMRQIALRSVELHATLEHAQIDLLESLGQ